MRGGDARKVGVELVAVVAVSSPTAFGALRENERWGARDDPCRSLPVDLPPPVQKRTELREGRTARSPFVLSERAKGGARGVNRPAVGHENTQ